MYKSFEKEAKVWLQDLEKYNDSPFVSKPKENQWSLGELYNHLIMAGDWNINKVHQCIAGEKGREGGNKTFSGLWTFQFGSIPRKYKQFELNEKYPPAIPESVASVKDKLIKLIKDMNLLESEVKQLSKKSLKYTVKHPKLGELNAKEWYRFVELHFKHHRGQKKKLEDFLITRSAKK